MKRDLAKLASVTFDVVVVGGGIGGACVAWDAALRGLSVALVERGDFAHATSAHSLKIVHGGIRYLQHADLERVRESSFERSAFLRMAPHLVHPLPFFVPTYGLGMKGRGVLGAAFAALGVLTADRNRGLPDPDQRIPGGRLVSRDEVLRRFPGLVEERGLTGAGVFCDGQIHNPPRLVLAVLLAAAEAGAVAANYCEARGLRTEGGRVRAVQVVDGLSGDPFEIQAGVVVNAAGPYAEELFVRAGLQDRRAIPLSRDMAIVIPRRLLDGAALAVQTKYRDPEALFTRGNRHLFMVPWREYTLIGVNSRIWEEAPSSLAVSEEEVRGFVDEINEANPRIGLRLDDVSVVNAGLLPFGENTPGSADLTFGKRSHVIDHARRGGPDGLVTAMSVRLTTGRVTAEKAVDLAFRKLGRTPPRCRTAWSRVHGGDVEGIRAFTASAVGSHGAALGAGVVEHLVRNHGSAYAAIARLVQDGPELGRGLGASRVIHAEVVHGVREEMAQKLTDVVLRRTDLGTGEHPGREALEQCAHRMAAELGWDAGRVRREIDEAEAAYPGWSPAPAVG